MFYRRTFPIYSAFAISTVLVGNAHAQEVQPADTAAPALAADIVVTAQRRDQNLSKTPVAISFVSGDVIAKSQIVTEQDIRFAAPGLTIRTSNGSNDYTFALRGQCRDAASAAAPGVLPYINEVASSGFGGPSTLFDLQSIQVLKGPQGTLFGRSATGGAVLITTAKPTTDLGGYISGSYGNYRALKLEGAINVPLSGDDLLARFSGFYQKRDGFQHNIIDNGREGDLDRYALRTSITAKFGDGIKNDLVVNYASSNSAATLGVLSSLTPYTGAAGVPPFINIEGLYAGTDTPQARALGIATLQSTARVSQAVATAYYDAYFANPNHPTSGILGVLNAQIARGPFVVDSDGANYYKAQDLTLTNTTTFELGHDTKIKNIFGYLRNHSLVAVDSDGTPYAISQFMPKPGLTGPGQNRDTTINQISEELQLGGNIANRLDYVLGGYYYDRSTDTQQRSGAFDILLGGRKISTTTRSGCARMPVTVKGPTSSTTMAWR